MCLEYGIIVESNSRELGIRDLESLDLRRFGKGYEGVSEEGWKKEVKRGREWSYG
jgi:hypothetical protein